MGWERLSPAQRAWYARAVGYFGGLGFFADLAGRGAEAAAAAVAARVARRWDEPLPAGPAAAPQQADLYLLTADPARVWQGDLERITRGAQAYVDLLRAWAAISRGSFAPEDLRETWRSDDGPVDVAIGWRGHTERFRHADGRDDFVDLGILRLLNRLIAGAGYRFEVCDALGMPNVVLVLTPAERGRLVRERGWSFYDL